MAGRDVSERKRKRLRSALEKIATWAHQGSLMISSAYWRKMLNRVPAALALVALVAFGVYCGVHAWWECRDFGHTSLYCLTVAR